MSNISNFEISNCILCKYNGTDDEVIIPDGVIGIEGHAFSNCQNLTGIKIPNSVEYIPYGAFSECSNLTSIIIPNRVSRIGPYAFSGCSNLKSISLPECLTEIDYDAFSGCEKLTSIEFPDSLITIGSRAFEGCTGFESIKIPNSVTDIREDAFINCSNLKSITIPEELICKVESAFKDCGDFEIFTIANDNSEKDYDIKGSVLVKYLGTEKNVVTPKGVRVIGKRAFSNNDNIERITISDNIQIIQEHAFADCSNIKDICFEGKVKELGPAFDGCKALEKIDLPEGIQTIKFGTFDGCENLKTVNIPEGVKVIDFCAFEGMMSCVPIEELILPDSVEYLGNGNITPGGYFKKPGDELFKRIHLGKGLKTIAANAPNYYEFDIIEFDSDFSHVFDKRYSDPEGDDPFSGNVYTDFSLDEENPHFKYENGLLLSKDGKILYSCMVNNVDEIVVPKGVEKVMGHAFSNVKCGKIVIPGDVKDMRGSFVSAKIGTLILSEGITEINSYAFLKSDINELVLPNTLKNMQGLAFMDVKKLKSLKLPCNNFAFGKFQTSFIGSKEEKTPFWFDSKAGFNDLEYVELIDDAGNTVSRMGMPSEKEQRQVKEEYHYILDEFIETKGNPSGIRRLYGHLKNKTSKLQLLYGVLSMDILSDAKTGKELVLEILKNKTALKNMAIEREDKDTEDKLKEVINLNKKQ